MSPHGLRTYRQGAAGETLLSPGPPVCWSPTSWPVPGLVGCHGVVVWGVLVCQVVMVLVRVVGLVWVMMV